MDKRTDHSTLKGQALVETAIILPILLIMMIGVLEVGWALRGYLVLSNANREAARWAAKRNSLDFSQPNPGYEDVLAHTNATIGGQIPFTTSGTMIVSYFHFDVPCTGTFTVTTPIQVSTYTWKYPISATETTKMDYTELIEREFQQQRAYACSLVGTSYAPQEHNLIAVEMWYYQKQLLGFPGINLFDPVPFYTHSVFRRYESER